jgi:hypothetical protein
MLLRARRGWLVGAVIGAGLHNDLVPWCLGRLSRPTVGNAEPAALQRCLRRYPRLLLDVAGNSTAVVSGQSGLVLQVSACMLASRLAMRVWSWSG